jgi:hypothetical protein
MRTISGTCVFALALLVSGHLLAQDSGPGPIPGAAAEEQTYDVTIIRFINVSTGAFTFAAEALPEGEVPTESTTGTFTAVINDQTSTGTWYALDLGDFAVWYATASGTSTRTYAIGYSTPDLIAGRLTTLSTTATARQRLRALFQTSFFYGTPEEVVEEPMPTAD